MDVISLEGLTGSVANLAIPESAVPNNNMKLGIMSIELQIFFHVINLFLCIYYRYSVLIEAFLSNQPHHHRSSSSTQFSQDCAGRCSQNIQ